MNSRKDLYVEERLPESRRKFDGQLGAMLDRIVVMFSRTGQMLGYLGQEGPGGSPFPYIERVAVTESDDAVVVTRAAKAWIVFWFDPAGKLVSRLEVPLERLPMPETAGVIPSLDTIQPAPDRRALYLKLSYYIEAIDEATRRMYRVENLPSRVYTLDVETGKYDGWVEVPRNLRREEGFGMFERLEVEYGYEFIGAARGGFLYFISPSDSNLYELLVLHESGRVAARRTIVVEDSELVYKTLSVSADGIVSALSARTTEPRSCGGVGQAHPARLRTRGRRAAPAAADPEGRLRDADRYRERDGGSRPQGAEEFGFSPARADGKRGLRSAPAAQAPVLAPDDAGSAVVYVAGKGNNGGDALVMARHAWLDGMRGISVVLASQELRNEPAIELGMVRSLGIPVFLWSDDREAAQTVIRNAGWIVDGLSGTGLSGALRPPMDEIVGAINASGAKVAAIDVPSGLGERFRKEWPAVKAALTLTMGLPKLCMYLPAARALCGLIEVIDPGFPPALIEGHDF